MISRADQSVLTNWWYSVDRTLLSLIVVLAVCGAAVSLAATPAAALRFGVEPFYFAKRHAATLAAAVIVMIAVSMLDPRSIRRLALVLFAVGVVLMAAALVQGIERNGATRWLFFAGLVIQPSEFAKPGFVVLSAWLLSESLRRPDMPGLPFAVALLALFCGLMVLQPDMGQALLVAGIWAGLFFLSGYPLTYLPLVAGAGLAGIALAYVTLPHFASRIDRFFGGGDTHQADVAVAIFREAGWFGNGLGDVFTRSRLPDAHNDYIFAALAGQLGIAACLFIILLYALIVWRGMKAATREQHVFTRLAVLGLIMLFGFQLLTNIAVNLNLLPAKGMTLPFLSYGRSSLLGTAVSLGMVLGLTRRWPESRLAPDPYAQVQVGLVPFEGVRR
jgi:cell division protein FtsW